ncbi:MAG TPA: helix-turn-helix domain-containing protein [Pyrinomonadaceae bacterium]
MPNTLPDNFSYYGAVDDYRRELIARTLAQTEGNRAAAAKILGLPRPYLSRLIKSLRVGEYFRIRNTHRIRMQSNVTDIARDYSPALDVPSP